MSATMRRGKNHRPDGNAGTPLRSRLAMLLGEIASPLPLSLWVGGCAMIGAICWLCAADPAAAQDSLRDVMERGEQDPCRVVCMRARARLAPGERLGAVSPDAPFSEVTLCRTARPSCSWAVVANDRAVVGNDDCQYIICNGKVTGEDNACRNPRGFLGNFLWGSLMFDVEEARAAQSRVRMMISRSTSEAGRPKMHVTVEPINETPNPQPPTTDDFDAGWFDLSYTKHYQLDIETGQLEHVTVHTPGTNGPVLLFETLDVSG